MRAAARVRLVLVAIVARSAAADPPVEHEPPLEPPASCSTRLYLEPSLLVTQTRDPDPGLFTRVGAGVLVRSCDSPLQMRAGATTYFGAVGDFGLGGELEAAIAVSTDARLGAHVAYESAYGGALYSADLRLHCCDGVMWLQVGGYHWSTFGQGVTGVAGGIGFESGPGAVLGGLELGIGGTFLLLLLQGLSHTK